MDYLQFTIKILNSLRGICSLNLQFVSSNQAALLLPCKARYLIEVNNFSTVLIIHVAFMDSLILGTELVPPQHGSRVETTKQAVQLLLWIEHKIQDQDHFCVH